MDSTRHPRTLQEAIVFFANPDNAFMFMVALRWPDGKIACPGCQSSENSFLEKRRVWQCKNKDCRKQFSLKVGTIFEDSPIGLDKWLPCLWLITNAKNGISSYEVHRAIGVTQKTAWFMLHRIRCAMQTETFSQFGGVVEADETFIGGRGRFMHAERKKRILAGPNLGKTAVMGLLQRTSKTAHSKVRVAVTKTVDAVSLQSNVTANVKRGSAVFTDEAKAYLGLEEDYIHKVINHAERYVDGRVHTNGMENFWSLLKRAIKGTYVAVEPFHLFRYLDEEARRFNERHLNDGERFINVVRNIVGKRLTYDSVTGKGLEAATI